MSELLPFLFLFIAYVLLATYVLEIRGLTGVCIVYLITIFIAYGIELAIFESERFQWNTVGLFGKIFAAVLAYAVVLGIVTAPVLILTCYKKPYRFKILGGLAGATVGYMCLFFVRVMIACAVTGRCL